MKNKFFAAALTVLGFALSTGASAGFVDSRTVPAEEARAEQSEAAAATTKGAPPVAAQQLVAAPAATVSLRAGKRMDEELRRIAPAGWTVDSAPFVLPGDFVVTNEFESAVSELMRASNAAGVRIRARFYHGNKILRVVEY